MKNLLKRIHINQWNIRKNKKFQTNLPVITCKTYKDNKYYHQLRILSDPPVTIKYQPDDALPCGATVWIETRADVEGDLL